MNLANLPALRSGTHVTFDTPTTERLVELGAANVVRASDRLIIGPCRRDVLEHERVREAWWNSPEGEKWDRLYESDVRWERPVVLWVSASLHERVNLWRACSWLRQIGIPQEDVLILDFEAIPPRGIPEEPWMFDCRTSVSDYSDEVLLERLAGASPWPQARYDRAVSLWDSYVDANPLTFVESCIQGVEEFPELAPLWSLLSRFFPRKTPEGALRLSRFDQLILNILSTEWQTPVAVFVHKSALGVELRDLLSCTGDLFLPERLEQWTAHGAIAAVEHAPGPRPPEYPLLSLVYRITDRGRRLREEGLAQIADAPALPIAGVEAYAPSAPWVLCSDGQLALP